MSTLPYDSSILDPLNAEIYDLTLQLCSVKKPDTRGDYIRTIRAAIELLPGYTPSKKVS